MRQTTGLSLILCTMTVSTAMFPSAADATTYTLDDCIRIALEKAVPVANAARDTEIAAYRIREARSEAFPQLTARGSYTRLDSVEEFEFGGESVSLGNLENYATAVELSQLVYSGGRVFAALRAAGLSRSYADLGLLLARAEMVRDVTTSFNAVLLAEATLDVHKEATALQEKTVDQVRQFVKAGTASELDLMSAETQLANERTSQSMAKGALAVAREQFRTLARIDENDFELQGKLVFEPVNWKVDTLTDLGLKYRPEIRRIDAAADMKLQDVAATRSGQRPTLRGSFTYTGGNSYSMASFENEWSWHWTAGAALEWSLFNGGATRSAVAQKRIEAEKTMAQAEDLRRAVRLEIQQYFIQMIEAVETEASARKAVQLARKTQKVTEAAFEEGLVDLLEKLRANVNLSNARLMHAKALYAHMNAIARLRYAAGMTLGERE